MVIWRALPLRVRNGDLQSRWPGPWQCPMLPPATVKLFWVIKLFIKRRLFCPGPSKLIQADHKCCSHLELKTRKHGCLAIPGLQCKPSGIHHPLPTSLQKIELWILLKQQKQVSWKFGFTRNFACLSLPVSTRTFYPCGVVKSPFYPCGVKAVTGFLLIQCFLGYQGSMWT